jgi:DNA-binding FadR family transcriptional regulator
MSTVTPQPTRTNTIATALRDEILAGQYRRGERLPSERDLSERFAASRGAVREALKQLEQLGIASIQHGGARVVAIEECTLDVLGPLLDLHDIPDPKLVDEVMQMIGVLMREAAIAALEKASDEQLLEAQTIIDGILEAGADPIQQFAGFRQLGQFYVEVANHLVLRLMINGLRTSFLDRLAPNKTLSEHDSEALIGPVARIRSALSARNAEELGAAMQDLNRRFREATRQTLERARMQPTQLTQ